MNNNGIIRQCLSLSLEEQITICNEIQRSIARITNVNYERCDAICIKAMQEIVGTDDLLKTRRPKNVWGRCIVAYQLRQAGYLEHEIGTAFNRDHSTIHYMLKRMKDVFAYPKAYKDVIQMWNMFKRKLQDEYGIY